MPRKRRQLDRKPTKTIHPVLKLLCLGVTVFGVYLCLTLVFDVSSTEKVPVSDVQRHLEYTVLHEYPHDTSAFTQGLLMEEGRMWESTGLVGQSVIREVEITSGAVIREVPLEEPYFGEGMVIWGDRIIQLTWRNRKGFVYDKNTLTRIKSFSYAHEGWGITHNGKELIVTSGEAFLYFWDPVTLVETKRVHVTLNNKPVTYLNEIEWIDGYVFANVWQQDNIVIINPESGKVVGVLNLEALKQPGDVLNGIAYDKASNTVYVTGKLWPKLFALSVVSTPR